MEFYNTSFFVSRGEGPSCIVSLDKDQSWPATVHIVDSRSLLPKVTIHLQHRDWVNFKNSVLSADRKVSKFFLEVANEL